MTTQQASLLRDANQHGIQYINNKLVMPTVLIGEGKYYVAFNESVDVVQKATGSFFCVGEADVYTAFPKAWLIDRNLLHIIRKLSNGKVLVVDSL